MKRTKVLPGFFGIFWVWCLVFLSHLLPGPCVVEAAEKVPHPVPRLDSKIRIDGVLDDEAWQQALKLELKYEVSPGENIKPPVRTEVFLFYGSAELYIGIHAYDPKPSAIRARFTDRDKISDDDWVSVSLDTFNDQRRIYTFSCNPLGIQWDKEELRREVNPNWDAIWASAGRISADGYIVEMAIPFRALRFQRKKEEQVWGFDVVRRYPRNLDHLIGFFPRDRNNNCYICQMEKLVGFKGARAGKSIEINPSVSTLFTQERENFIQGDWVKKESKVDPGITGHWSFTPNMKLSAAINPDFSHVEADVAQLDINTQFALFYPEKRPFFLEGASIFTTPLNAVYTRSLADPDWGIKVTGKEGPHGLGLYTVQDNLTNLLFPGSQVSSSTSLDMKSIGTVLRYRLDFGKRASSLGVLVTDREGEDYFNRLAGLDVYWRFSRKKVLSAQFLASQTRYPDQVVLENGQPDGKFSGTAMDFLFKHESRNIGYHLYYQQVSPDFRADLGFMPQVGYRRFIGVFIAASWRNPGHWYTFMNIVPVVVYEVDNSNNVLYKEFSLTYTYIGPLQSSVQLVGNLSKRAFMGQLFDTTYGAATIKLQPNRALTLQLITIFGNWVDVANVRQGKRFTLNPILTYKAGRRLSMSLDHVYERFNVDAGRLYTANVSNLSVVYNFSRRAFLRTILQYIHYDYNAANYTFPIDPKFKHLFSQILFSYKVNPRTVLFLGYSDDYYGYQFNPLTQNNRTLFLKIGYALVL